MTKTIITFLCFIFLAFCYWIFNDPYTWWKIPKIARGAFEFTCFFLCAMLVGTTIVVLWLN